MSIISVGPSSWNTLNPNKRDMFEESVFADQRVAQTPYFNLSKAANDTQKLNWTILNNALRDARAATTNEYIAGSNGELGSRGWGGLVYKKGAQDLDPNQIKALNLLTTGQAGTTAWKDVMGAMRNQYMDRYEGEQKGMQAQLERMRKLGLASQVPTANTPAAQREGALTAALQNGGGTSPMMHKGREVMSPFADRMRNYTQQQQQTQQPTQQQPQTQGAVYGGFGQSPLTQALQSGGQAQVTSNRYRPVTNWGSGGFRSVLSGF